MQNYAKIAVFAGGPSSEREISLKSGMAVYRALKKRYRDVDFVDVDHDFQERLKLSGANVVFLALHGRFGEDGTVQAMLEELNLSYTGSGVEASRLALDKAASRKLFLANGINVPRYKVIDKNGSSEDLPRSIPKAPGFQPGDEGEVRGAERKTPPFRTGIERGLLKEFKIPFVVKPQSEGSSIGLTVVRDKGQFKDALELAFGYDEKVLVEEYIHGRELTVGILEGQALPVIEIVPKNEIYDYGAKYKDKETKYIVPANLKEEENERAEENALRAHNVLGCRDFSRVDMRMDSDGNIFVLEINTIPGMTERSLLPKAAEAQGIGFEDLCMKLVDLAYRRGRKKNRN